LRDPYISMYDFRHLPFPVTTASMNA